MYALSHRSFGSSQARPFVTFPTAPLLRGVPALLLGGVALATLASLAASRSLLAQAATLDSITGLSVRLLGRAGVVLSALLLLLVARALARGKRQAWRLALALCALAGGSAVFNHRQWGYVAIPLLLLAGLLALAPLFSARSDRHAALRGYAAVVLSVALVTLYSLAGRLADTRMQALPLAARRMLLYGMRGAALGVLAYGIWALLRPVLAARRTQAQELAQAATVVAQHGAQAVAHFALGADKSYYWSASRRSLIAYRVAHGVALALGDPIGPKEEREEMVRTFLAYCRRQDWAVALYQATEATQLLYHRLSLHPYKIGEEAVVDLGRFTTQGKAGERVRHAVSRARRGGLTARIWQGEAVPDEIFAGMRRVSAAWLGGNESATQMGFSMGRFPADWSPELLTAVALDTNGTVQAFVTWTPLYAGNGWALDAMRRLPDATPGAMELLLAECFAWARERGAARMSLGLVPLAGLGESLPAGGAGAANVSLFERGAAYLHRRKLLLGGYTSLYRFKDQFQPTWEARYLVVADRTTLPAVFHALAWVHSYTGLTILKDAALALRAKAKATPAAPSAAGKQQAAA